MFRRVAILLVVGLCGCASQQTESLVVSSQEAAIQYQKSELPPPQAAGPATPALQPVAQQPMASSNDEAIAQKLVATSRLAYGGSCPCPYDVDRTGPCGDRSAYSQGKPNKPLCYSSDVTADMINKRRRGDAAMARGTN
jgi:hypothetical protein